MGSEAGLEVSPACRDLHLRMGLRMGWEMLGGGCGASRLFVTPQLPHPIRYMMQGASPILCRGIAFLAWGSMLQGSCFFLYV